MPGRAGPGNSEPFSYESGFAVKWLVEQQLKGDPALNYDPQKGTVQAPWLVAFRHTAIGHLLLGHVFSWQNLVAYGLGVLAGIGLDRFLFRGSTQ